MLWTHIDSSLTPQDIASLFASECFDDDRRVEHFAGHWKPDGAEFIGTFRLVDGAHVYKITGNLAGQYTVCQEEEWHLAK